MKQSGTFTVAGGAFVVPTLETTAPAAPKTDVGPLDVVNADDFIVQGKLCVGGPECVTGEAFGYDVIRMKELSTRITFDDTSTGAFPANDWRITANDNASGGANYLAFEDATGGKVPFKVMAGAPNNALFVSSIGNVGLGTNVPAVEFHIASTDTPTVRLEQLAYGWSPYTWEVAGNESNFFIRDVTGGSNLPFRIRPGAPNSAIDIDSNGNVGIGRATANYDLEVWNVSGDTTLGVTRDGGVTATLKASTAEARLGTANNFPLLFDVNNTNVMTLATNGNVGIGTTTPVYDLDVSNTGANAVMGARRAGGATVRMIAGAGLGRIGTENNFPLTFDVNNVQKMTLATSGALTVLGPVNATVFNTTSDKYAKENFTAIDQKTVLDRLSTMPISTWNFIENDNKAKHLGPMAQDFYAAFGLGADDKHISSVDADGVAFAAIRDLTSTQSGTFRAENTSRGAGGAAIRQGGKHLHRILCYFYWSRMRGCGGGPGGGLGHSGKSFRRVN